MRKVSPQIRQKGGKRIMEMTESDYTRWYIVQALFKLMSAGEYDGIGVTAIA